jgi:hypothetical protein
MDAHPNHPSSNLPRNIQRPEVAAALGKEPWQQKIEGKGPITDLSQG